MFPKIAPYTGPRFSWCVSVVMVVSRAALTMRSLSSSLTPWQRWMLGVWPVRVFHCVDSGCRVVVPHWKMLFLCYLSPSCVFIDGLKVSFFLFLNVPLFKIQSLVQQNRRNLISSHKHFQITHNPLRGLWVILWFFLMHLGLTRVMAAVIHFIMNYIYCKTFEDFCSLICIHVILIWNSDVIVFVVLCPLGGSARPGPLICLSDKAAGAIQGPGGNR